jgi:hypothetical protein
MSDEMDDLVERLATQEAARLKAALQARVDARVKELMLGVGSAPTPAAPRAPPTRTARQLAADTAAAKKQRVRHPKHHVVSKSDRAHCPKCGKDGNALKDFGVKTITLVSGPTERVQSYCRECRKAGAPKQHSGTT